MQHRKAKEIPAQFLSDPALFNGKIAEPITLFVAANAAGCRAALQTLNIQDLTEQIRKCIFLTIAFRQASLPKEQLLAMGRQLNLEMSVVLEVSVILNHHTLFHYLITQLSEAELWMAIRANDYRILRSAARHGRLERMRELINGMPPAEEDIMLYSADYAILREAALAGQLAVVKDLLRRFSLDARVILRASYCDIFANAASHGQLGVVKYLIYNMPPQEKINIIQAANYRAFRSAALGGHVNVMHYLRRQASNVEKIAMIQALNYNAFVGAATTGQLPVLKQLIRWAPEYTQAMLAASDYAAFCNAALYGRDEVMQQLIVWAKDNVKEMIKAREYYVFHVLITNGRTAMVSHLLTFSVLFAYVEFHHPIYGEQFIYPVTTAVLAKIRAEINTANKKRRPFDVSVREAEYLFYVLRNLIRRSDPDLQEDIALLLTIPAVRQWAHLGRTPKYAKNLLRLASKVGNLFAVEQILDVAIPTREALAAMQRENEAASARLALDRLAENREGALVPLTPEERKRLGVAWVHYGPIIETEGALQVMVALRQMLSERYTAHPATMIFQRGVTAHFITLPLSWDAFIEYALQLGFSAEERTRALQAYYQHADHTAWRYLLKPNPWIHPDAEFVVLDLDRPYERWANFENHQPTIAMFFLAAKDETMPPSEGFTVATRVDEFVHTLAYLGRAHNWDKTHPAMSSNGRFFMEAYDDLEADRPVCFVGAERDIFHSVADHPLLKNLSQQTIDEEIRGFVRQHVEESVAAVSLAKRALWCAAWENYICDPSDEDCLKQLKECDIPPAKQAVFLVQLALKYGEQFVEEKRFRQQVKTAFRLSTVKDAHVLNFGHFGIEQFFQSPRHPASVSNPARLFSRAFSRPAISPPHPPTSPSSQTQSFTFDCQAR